METAGKRVPAAFAPRCSSTRSSSSAYPFWPVRPSSCESSNSGPGHILTKADELAARLNTFADDLRRRPGLPVSQTLRQETTQLLLRFTTVRARFVADLVHAGLGMPGLRVLHPELAIIGRIYAHDSASLPGFLKSVEDQIATQSVVHTDTTAQEDYCSKAFLCYARGFIRGLKGGAAPESAGRSPGIGRWSGRGSVGCPRRGGPAAADCSRLAAGAAGSRRGRLVIVTACVLDRTAAFGGIRSGTLRRQRSVDVIARKTATGFRAAGPLSWAAALKAR
jgi:hypothetical protein